MPNEQELWSIDTHAANTKLVSAPHRSKSVNKKRRIKFKTAGEKWINYFEKRARKALKKKRKKNKKGKSERLILTPLEGNKYIVLDAPANFSLINNTEEVIRFFREAALIISKRHQVELNLENITHLTPDAIALLIAKVKDRNFTRGLNIRGTKPKKKELKRLFEESGFLDHVRSSYTPPKNEKNLLIHQVTRKKVDPIIAKKVGQLSVSHTFKNDKIFQPIYKIMIECMANTDNHADLQDEGVHDWWLFTYCDPNNNVTSYTFLDLGVGIFNSNPVGTFRQQFLTSAENIAKLNLTSKYNLAIVPKLFSGEIYTSRTKEKDRGQGLPTIHELAGNPHIKNFTVIANNVKIELPTLSSLILDNKFNGTLLSWELHP